MQLWNGLVAESDGYDLVDIPEEGPDPTMGVPPPYIPKSDIPDRQLAAALRALPGSPAGKVISVDLWEPEKERSRKVALLHAELTTGERVIVLNLSWDPLPPP